MTAWLSLLPLIKDGDLIALARYMIRHPGSERRYGSLRLRGMLRMSDVQHGRVRLEDQLGNAEADAAADLRSSSSV